MAEEEAKSDNSTSIKLLILSDTHGKHNELKLPANLSNIDMKQA